MFEEELALVLHPEQSLTDGLTVMFLDLDDFKQVNDSLGHRTGDKLLVEIARRLSAITGPRDLVARWGGDEFVILHRHSAGQSETAAMAKRIIDEINRAVVIDGSEVIVGASIGSASAATTGPVPTRCSRRRISRFMRRRPTGGGYGERLSRRWTPRSRSAA